MAKRGNGEGAIYKTSGGMWRGSIDLGWEDGKRKRKYFAGRTRADVAGKVRKALEQADDGTPFTTDGAGPTFGEWLDYWLEFIQGRKVRVQTLHGHYDLVNKHVRPTLGRVRLRKLTTEQVEQLEAKLEETLAPRTVVHVHRTLFQAIKAAKARGLVAQNVVSNVTPPTVVRAQVKALDREGARKLLATAANTRQEARWVVALALGLRQSEALGLAWDNVDLDLGTIRVAQTLRPALWRHGCVVDGKATCGGRPLKCPKRRGAPRRLEAPKSKAGTRTLTLPVELVSLLRAAKAAQRREQLAAGNQWWSPAQAIEDGKVLPAPEGMSWDLVFRSPLGKPVHSNADYQEWVALLAAAGLPRRRLHDARHTAATLLLVMRVAPRVVQEILGHAKFELTMTTYSHVIPELQQDAADRMGDALWGEAPAARSAAAKRTRRPS